MIGAVVTLPPFDIVRRVGEGGFGVVYEAVDRTSQRRVALKVLHPSQADHARLRREFRVLQDIAHPNLVALGELCEHAGLLYFTMDFVDGVDFLVWVGRVVDREQVTMRGVGSVQHAPAPAHALDADRLRDAVAQLADGLAALHAHDLVHRDVKPQNALVTPEGRVVLLDFGLAAPAHAPTGDRDVYGTPAYMAPEQLAGRAVGPPADCYAAGVMLYEALAGRLPFTGDAEDMLVVKERLVPEPPADAPRDLAQLCTALMAADPAARPTARALATQLGRRPIQLVTTPQRAVVPQRPFFVGRHDELNELVAQLAAVRGGATRAVTLRGESGIGKSSLARRLIDEHAGDALVLWSRCYERETLPFKAVDGVVEGLASAAHGMRIARDLADAAACVFPALGRALGGDAFRGHVALRDLRGRAFDAVRELLEQIGRERVVVIVIDDLQWTDLDSVALLARVLAPPEPPRLLFVGCVRDDAAAAARGAALAALPTDLRQITLGPLDARAATELATSALEGSGGDAAAIARDAGGHPLFTIALARNVGSARGRTLGEVLVGRLQRLPDEARRLVEIVCIAHVPLALATARAAANVSDTHEVAAALRVAQLVRTSGPRDDDAVEPYHDRVRAAVAATIAPAALPQLHAAIARALEATGPADPDLEALALHWAHAGDPAAASRYARIAADRAARVLAFERAATLYRWLLELDPEASDRRSLFVQLGDALSNAGRAVDAAEAFLEAARLLGDRTHDALTLRRRAMQHLFLSGRIARGLALLDELAHELDVPNPDGPRATLAALLLRRARLALRRVQVGTPRPERLGADLPARVDEAGAFERARIDFCFDAASGLGFIDALRGSYFQTMNCWMSLANGDPSRVARAYVTDAVYHAASGPSRSLERALARCDHYAARTDLVGREWGMLARGVVGALIGRWRMAADTLAACAQLLRDAVPSRMVGEGVAFNILATSTNIMVCGPLLYLGRLRELRKFTATHLRAALERSDLATATHFRTGTQTTFWLTLGNVDAAVQHADDGIAPWLGTTGNLPAFMDLQARTTIDLYRGDADAAAARVHAGWRTFAQSLLLRVQYVRITLNDLRGRTAVAAAQRTSGRVRRRWLGEADGAAARLAAERAEWAQPLALAIRAGARAVRGGDPARELAGAIAAFDAADMALHAAIARLAAGDLERRGALVWLAAENVAAPERLAGVLAPGLAPAVNGGGSRAPSASRAGDPAVRAPSPTRR